MDKIKELLLIIKTNVISLPIFIILMGVIIFLYDDIEDLHIVGQIIIFMTTYYISYLFSNIIIKEQEDE